MRAGYAHSGMRGQRRQLTQRRQMRHTEGRVRSHSGIDGELLEVLRGIPERHAAIALAMFVAALEAVPWLAQHQRAGRHQPTAERGAVLKTACEHDRNDVMVMLFFERAI